MGTTTTPTTLLGPGAVVQVVHTTNAAMSTGTTTIPADDTIPQITEGTEFMTASITPKNAANRLRVEVLLHGSLSIIGALIAALFRDATAAAIVAAETYIADPSGYGQVRLVAEVTAGSTSSTTFRVRAGGNAASTVTFNGVSGARYFGGVQASSITITEIAA